MKMRYHVLLAKFINECVWELESKEQKQIAIVGFRNGFACGIRAFAENHRESASVDSAPIFKSLRAEMCLIHPEILESEWYSA